MLPPENDLTAYARRWNAAAERQRTEALMLEALAWDTDAALAGNLSARADLPRYGRKRRLRCLIVTARDLACVSETLNTEEHHYVEPSDDLCDLPAADHARPALATMAEGSQ